ncbi:MAG TPA: hypothetical protein VN259_14940 [Xanthomonadales bacterium]|nr:hypothetical protein [Xanthomonadales bacterium]
MTDRLQAELQRLYLPQRGAHADADASLIDPHGARAMLLELARPADWEQLSKVWRGVQTDLELPAPAIAVSGSDGFALWFSLAEPVPLVQAHAFLQALCARYLPELPARRLRLMPTADDAASQQAGYAQFLPPRQQPSGYWSAFIAADLAPIFADTPWLDSAPGNDGQAGILSPLASIMQPAFDAALERLDARVIATQPSAIDITHAVPAPAAGWLAPKQFLLQIMNDDSVPLALRIEAAKALLPYFDGHQ